MISELTITNDNYTEYLGVKRILAKHRTANENDKRGIHPIGADGYEVKYSDSYTSWSPKEIFDDSHIEVNISNDDYSDLINKVLTRLKTIFNIKKVFVVHGHPSDSIKTPLTLVFNELIKTIGEEKYLIKIYAV